MAIQVFRFKLTGPTTAALQAQVPASPTPGGFAPAQFFDVSVDSASQQDLVDYMMTQGFVLDSTDPTTTVSQQANAVTGVASLVTGTGRIVRAATTANITLSGPQTIDGVSVVAGDRVLVKDQTTQSENGIYVVETGAWSFASDYATGAVACMFGVDVQEGTAQTHSHWDLHSVPLFIPIVVGTTTVRFQRHASITDAAQLVTVATDGSGEFSSIATALASITDATATKPYVICVLPGVYNEAPFACKANVTVMGMGNWNDVIVQTTNNSADFITSATLASLKQLVITGPTGTGFSAIDCQHTGAFFLDDIVIRKGYYGVRQHGTGQVMAHQVVNQFVSGATISRFVFVESGNFTGIMCAAMSGTVTNGFYITGSTATATLDVCAYRSSGQNDAIYVDDGGFARVLGFTADCTAASAKALHLGPNGTGTKVFCTNMTIGDNWTKDVVVDASTSTLVFTGVARENKVDIASGATVTASYSDNTVGEVGQVVFGELFTDIAAANSKFPVSKWVTSLASAGLATGGVVTRSTGLGLSIAAGTGFVTTGGVVRYVSWNATTANFAANVSNQYVWIDSSGVVQVGAEPDVSQTILLAEGTTDATSVIALITAKIPIGGIWGNFSDYTEQVVGPINVTGGTVTEASPPSLNLNVTASTFYIRNVVQDASGGTPITFVYWYRDGSGGWKFVTSQTAIDPSQYDDGSGTLASVTAGYWTRHVLFVSVGGDGTEYHVVYSQAQWATSGAALDNPIASEQLATDACRLAAVVVQQGTTDITSVTDQRPRLGQFAPQTVSITAHGDLTGLGSNDHPQYQLISEKGAASGYAPLDAGTKVTSTYLNLATAAPAASFPGGAVTGTSTDLARKDHGHDVTVATPIALTVGGSNSAGTASSVSRSDHAHALPAFGTGAGTFAQGNDARLSDSRTPTGAANGDLAGTYPSPTIAATTRVQVGNVRQARAASTANVASLSGTTTIDGVSLIAGDRVLLKDQTTASQNGKWVIAAGAWTRPADWVTGAIIGELAVNVSEGTVNAHTAWQITTQGTITVDTTSITFTKISATATASTPVGSSTGATGTATDYSRGDHAHGVTYGTGADTVAQGNDSRLSDDRTASGLRSATTVVSVSGATAPTSGQVLTATSGTAATWQSSATSVLVQTASTSIAADTTTTSTTFVDLITIVLTTGANKLLVRAMGAASNTNANRDSFFRLTVDGTSIGGGSGRSPSANAATAFAIEFKTATLTAASHTVKLQWRVSANTGQIRPITGNVDAESATLTVEEVTI